MLRWRQLNIHKENLYKIGAKCRMADKEIWKCILALVDVYDINGDNDMSKNI